MRYTKFTNAMGRGNRVSAIAVTTTVTVLPGSGAGISNLVNGSAAGNYANSVEFADGETGKEIKFDFGPTNKQMIAGYTFRLAGSMSTAGVWKLVASDNDVSYVDITGSAEVVGAGTFNPALGSNLGFYRYYKLLLTSGTTHNSPWHAEVEFCSFSEDATDHTASIAPSYANFLGSGDRRLYIAMGGNMAYGGGVSYQMLDGTNTAGIWFLNGQSGRTVEFEFGSSVLVTEITWVQDNAATHGTWQWQRYDDDSATWVNEGSTFTLGGSTNQVISAMAGATEYAHKFRLAQQTGATSSSCYTRGISFKIGYPKAPADGFISSVAPNTGPETGSTSVVITGEGFAAATSVEFDGDAASNFSVTDDTEITCDTPMGTVGPVDVTVITPTGNITLVNGFTYTSVVPPPSFTSVTPDEGPQTGNTSVVIIGDDLTGVTDVKFGGSSATSIVVVDDETITCDTPAHAGGTVDIELVYPGGSVVADDAFTYASAAVVTQVPLLVMEVAPQPLRLTQVPLLIPYAAMQPLRVTQAAQAILWTPTPIPLPLPIVPELPVTEEWEYLTVVNLSARAKEQRSSLRLNPRLTMSFEALLLNDADRREAYVMLRNFINRSFTYPLYSHSTRLIAAANTGTSKLLFNPNHTDMRDGEALALFNPQLDQTHLVMISTVDVDGATLTTPLEFDVPAEWLVCPAPEFRTGPSVGLAMRSVAGDFTLDLIGVKQREVLRPGQATNLLTMIDGMLVLDKQPLANSDVDEIFEIDTKWLDNEINTPEPHTLWPSPFAGGQREYLIHRPEGMDYWRLAASYLKGRQKPFLLPTFRDDLPLIEIPALGATVLVSSNIQFYEFWRSKAWRYVRIQSQAGTIYRRILEVTANYNTNGQPLSINIELESGIGAGVGANVDLVVSYVNTCRLASDTLTFRHEAVDSIVTIQTRMIEE